MEYRAIEAGDTVRVDFNNGQITLCHKAIVKNKPYSAGDSWIFYDLETSQIHYVSEGCTVTLLSKEDTPF